MHILFLSDNFPPEGNAPASRTYEHTREWVKAGVEVTVITGAPNFPEGKVFTGYKNKWLTKDIYEGIRLWRVKTYITANEGFFKRTLDFLSFMWASMFFGLFTKKVDLVIGTSPQFFTACAAWFLAKVKRVPFVFELRDIWPASITAVGAMKKGIVITVLEKIEMFLYRQADLIVSVTQSFKEELIERGVDAQKIEVIRNGVDLERFRRFPVKDETLVHEYNLAGKFVAGYVGTHGMAHALEKIVDAADRLLHNDSIRFIFAGGGADRLRIEKLVAEKGLSNIVLIPRQPKERMPALWSLCDVSLVTLKNTQLFETVIPSKIFEAMGMGVPIIIAVPEGEATQIIRATGSGLVIEPENSVALATAVEQLFTDRELCQGLGNAGSMAAKSFDRTAIASDMLGKLLDVSAGKNASG